MLSPEELSEINKQLVDNYHRYNAVSDQVIAACNDYKRQNPHSARVVFSRVPAVKTVESIVGKIGRYRSEGRKSFGFDDITDIIAITVLCAYETDIPEFIAWMRKTFDVQTPEEDSYRSTKDGHIGRHFIIRLKNYSTAGDLLNINCEIQIKTVLQEAFDAKSHDLAYKPKGLKVGEGLKEQFSLLSTNLKTIDAQSEFLKRLILRDKHEISRRRNASILLYRKQPEVLEAAVAANIDFEQLAVIEPVDLTKRLRELAAQGISRGLCNLAALCALTHGHQYLHSVAGQYANDFVKAGPEDGARYLFRGGIRWMLNRFDDAIRDVQKALELSKAADDVETLARSKNNLVYFISDWKCFENGGTQELYDLAAALQADLDLKNPRQADTLGLYRIAFGTTIDEIESGRALVRNAQKQEGYDSAGQFFGLHEYLAVSKILELMMQDRLSQSV